MDSSKRGLESINPNKAPVKKTESKTIRLTIDLSKTDKDGCAIFNYQELVKAEKKKLNVLNKPKQLNNGTTDPFNNEDEEALKKIALQYEEKYGSASNMRYQTYTELGAGYDESDSFIDNTEACEEGVPEDTEPKRGGFYVNTGKLEYKRIYGYFDPKISKRKLQRESESGDDECSSEEKRIKNDGRPEKTEKIEKLEDSEYKMSNGKKTINKAKKVSKMKITDEGTKERSKSSSYVEVNVEQIPTKGHSGSNSSETREPSISNESNECLDINPTDERKESYRSQSDVAVADKTENDSVDTVAALTESESSDSTDRAVLQKGEPPKLPELSSELVIIVNELKNLAGNYKSSQRKFFNDPTNSLLYRLESTCRKKLNSSGRHAVYSYLAHYLPFTKSTLVSRIKKIFIGNGQLESFIIRIKNVVTSLSKINEDYDLQRQSLEEIKPFLEKAVQIKVRQFIVMTTKKKDPLESYIVDFLSNIASIWPNGIITVNNLHNLVSDAIRMEAEAYNITYSPGFSFVEDATPLPPPSMSLNDIILNHPQKVNTEQDEEIVGGSIIGSSGNISNDGTTVSKEVKHKDDALLSPLFIYNNKDQDLMLAMKVSNKKQKNGGKWSQQSGKKIDDRGLDRETELREKCLPKFCSTDEKVQMQLDQVMQDLVVLNQMSSDTTSSTNTK